MVFDLNLSISHIDKTKDKKKFTSVRKYFAKYFKLVEKE